MSVTNSRGVQVPVYSTFADALNAQVVEPIAAGLGPHEDARQLYDVEAIGNAVLEWHTEYVERDGRVVEWLPANGWCYALGEEPAEFWQVVQDHQRVEGVES